MPIFMALPSCLKLGGQGKNYKWIEGGFFILKINFFHTKNKKKIKIKARFIL